MMRLWIRSLATLALAALLAPMAGAADYETLDGEVVDVRDAADDQGRGPFTEVKLRTRAQEERWVRLGPSQERGHAYRLGDQVRARVTTEADATGVGNAESVRNMTTGTRERLRTRDGTAVRQQDRTRARDGSCTGGPAQLRQRDRTHDGGSGGASGGGGHRGGGGR